MRSAIGSRLGDRARTTDRARLRVLAVCASTWSPSPAASRPPLAEDLVAAMAAAGRLRAAAHGPRRVPGRAAPRVSRCSCASVASTTTTTRTPSPSSTSSCGHAQRILGGLRRQPAAASRSATRARTCTACSVRRVAHEDDAARAAAAALELRELRAVDRGHATSRSASHRAGSAAARTATRCAGTFMCLGDAVNLAARLMSAAPPGRIYVSARGARRGRRRVHLGAACRPWRVKGKARARRGVGARRLAANARRRRGDAVPSCGWSAGRAELAHLTRELDDALAGRRQRGRDRGRGGHGQVAAGRRVRRARRAARGLLVAVGECQAFGTQHELLRVARGLATRCSRLEDDDAANDAACAKLEAALGGDRSRARPARAAAVGRRRPRRSPTTSSPRVRREAAQDLARGPARRHACAARGERRAVPRRARGLSLDRRAVARPPRGPRRDGAGAAASCSCSPTGPPRSRGGGLGLDRLPHSRSSR